MRINANVGRQHGRGGNMRRRTDLIEIALSVAYWQWGNESEMIGVLGRETLEVWLLKET